MRFLRISILTLLSVLPGVAGASINAQSDSSDGFFNPQADTTVDLSLAPTALWTTPGSGNGVYDSTKWAVVFKYSEVDIPTGVTVTFTNHPSGAPVVWLVGGNAKIDGDLDLSGHNQVTASHSNAEGGPGGFRGGMSKVGPIPGGSGFGPGGGNYSMVNNAPRAGSYSTVGQYNSAGSIYGNERNLPLIGGSGGQGQGEYNSTSTSHNHGGGGGGGAILVVARDTLGVDGSILSDGGDGRDTYPPGHQVWSGSGSGGGIRLIGDLVQGTGTIRALGGGLGSNDGRWGGQGRIRLEGNLILFDGSATLPATTPYFPLDGEPEIWADSTAPTVRVVSIDGIPVPLDPRASLTAFPGDLALNADPPVEILLEAQNVPPASAVTVRVAPRSGSAINEAASEGQVAPMILKASFRGGNKTLSTWSATLDSLPASGFVAVQARAVVP